MRPASLVAAALCGAIAACGAKESSMKQPVPGATSPLAADAVRGVHDAALVALLADHWEWTMRWQPAMATTVGDHRYDDRLTPRAAADIARFQAERRELAARIHAIDPALLDDADR